MAGRSLPKVLQQVRKLAAVQTGRALSDRELLERFVADNDEAAFTVLVERHGRLVQGACRRALGNTHDPRTPVRPRSWSWPARPLPSARRRHWVAGCTAWPVPSRRTFDANVRAATGASGRCRRRPRAIRPPRSAGAR